MLSEVKNPEILLDWRPEIFLVGVQLKDGVGVVSVVSPDLRRLLSDKTPFHYKQIRYGDTPNDRVYILNSQQLQTGDVILSTTREKESKFIRIGTMGPVSHAALHIGGGFLIEAVDSGVRKAHARSFVFPRKNDIRVLRPRRASSSQLEKASQIARSLVYRPYSTWNAIATVFPALHRPHEYGRFCSQIVAESYDAAGFSLTKSRPFTVTPARLLRSSQLEDVTEGVVRAIRNQSWLDVVRTLHPDSHSIASWPDFDRWCSPYNYELAVLTLANASIKRGGIANHLRLAYNYFDLMKLLTQNFNIPLVRRFDEQLALAMNTLQEHYWVVPKGLVDGLIGRPIMWDVNSKSLPRNAAYEFKKLLTELDWGSKWNEVDVSQATGEIEAAAEKSQSPSVASAARLVRRDWGYMLDEYGMLGLMI
jgi:uncharacterized protein YycO